PCAYKLLGRPRGWPDGHARRSTKSGLKASTHRARTAVRRVECKTRLAWMVFRVPIACTERKRRLSGMRCVKLESLHSHTLLTPYSSISSYNLLLHRNSGEVGPLSQVGLRAAHAGFGRRLSS